ncbi:MAG: hypothetical protein PHQ23_00770 [Candidatus Wallbacteria bacterium]|nr:hypothetical protein [Candidatus Wallbacteria bacterium]
MGKCDICGKKLIICTECETEFCPECDGGKGKVCSYCLEIDDEDDDDLDDLDEE